MITIMEGSKGTFQEAQYSEAIQLDNRDVAQNKAARHKGSMGYLMMYVNEILRGGAETASDRRIDPGANPLEALMQGMSQLQAAMAMQMGMAASRAEVIRPGVSGSELPKLPEPDDQAAINVGDWLHGLAGPMRDITDGSSRWWTEVLSSLDAFYGDYVAASTVKKVQLRAEDYATKELRDTKWSRLDKRAASMLLQAVPEGLKSELMANRLSSTISILGRILTIYRPGSAAERQQVLRALESPGGATSPADLVEVLRRWMRWLKRAQDLGLQVPDASILLKGLDTASKQQMDRNGEIVFRSNMLRYSLDLDAAPTLQNVLRYHGHLLAEFEQLSFRGRSKPTGPTLPTVKNVSANGETSTTTTPKAGSTPTPSGTPKPCKFFLSDTGCQRASCRFSHDWQHVPKEDRHDKCKNCGGKGHLRKFCPMKQNNEGGRKGDDSRGSGQPRVKNLAQERKEDAPSPMPETTTSSIPMPSNPPGTSSTTAQGPTTTEGPAPATSTTSNEDLLRSATQILKLMAEQGNVAMPSMKMLKKAVTAMESRMALVDSGATHPLRQATNPEWQGSSEVDVLIAGDGVAKMRQTESGTLLTDPLAGKSQTILPVGGLVSILGYELQWTKKKCVLRGPDGREIPLRTTTGCPEIDETTALELIAKIEEEKLQQLAEKAKVTQNALMRACKVESCEQWQSSMKDYVLKGKFEDGFRALVSMPWLRNVPREDLVKIVMDLPGTEAEAWDLMKDLGFNRRYRKRLVHRDWVVKFYSGRKVEADKIFRPMTTNTTVVLDVDLLRNAQMDVLKQGKGIFMLMMWGAATGRVAGIMSSIPNEKSDDHLVRMMALVETAREGRRAMCELSDVPNDEVAISIWGSSEAEEDSSAKALQRGWMKHWVAESGLQKLYFEQGGLGHPLRRPTYMVTNMDITELRGVRDEREHECLKGSKAMWAPMMMHVLNRGWKRWRLRPGWYPRMVRALKAVDRKAWERHLANDHVPHRPDCLQCIHNATGRPHRRCLHKDCYVMSADTLGPVRVPGPKGERYAIVFTFQYPKQKLCPDDQPIAEEELGGWDLDVKANKGETLKEPELDELPDPLADVDLEEYAPSFADEELEEEETTEVVEMRPARVKEKDKEDWWEFRESAGVLIRHHEVPRKVLFRPTSANGCPLHTAKLDDTRITEVKYVGGGVETEISDWHGPKSGARPLRSEWTGTTRFRISPAEVPEDEAALQHDEEQWEKLVGDLVQPVELETIYMVYPVRAKRGGDAMLAIQEAVLRLKLMGFPVARLHTDRGSEYASRGLGRWLLDHDIYHTRSEALVPQTNGAAERGVRWFKTRAKVLLAEAQVDVKFWTLAMQHAANRRIYDRLGITKPPLLPFGSKVMIRRKIFGNNKKYDLTDRWEEGKYLGISDTIKGGAVVLRSTGALTETLNLRTGVVDPKVLLSTGGGEDEPELPRNDVSIVDLPEPDHRLKGKNSPPRLEKMKATVTPEDEDPPKKVVSGWTMRTMVQRQEQKAKIFYDMGKFDLDSCAEVLGEMELVGTMRNKARGMQTTSMILGAYVHGGMRGVTKSGKRRPQLTKYLNMVLRLRVAEDLGEDGSWTTIGVFKAADIPPHRDLRNQVGSWNYVMEIGGKSRAGLWVANGSEATAVRGGEHWQPLAKEYPDGRVIEGNLVCIGGKAVAFNPKEYHAYVDELPERWIVAAFTPLGAPTLSLSTSAYLSKCAFPLEGTGVQRAMVEGDTTSEGNGTSDDSEVEVNTLEHQMRTLRCALEQEDVDLEGVFPRVLNEQLEWGESLLHEGQQRDLRRVAKVSPGAAADYDVEPILEALSGPLEVVHNVGLHEARRNLPKWKAAILKEVEALVRSGTVRRLSPEQARELKAQGMVVLPGKAVFTAKPPSEQPTEGQEKFRRKCRIVVCGNYLPSDKANVYASGTSADGLRLSVAFTVMKRWRAAATDISNAFTLAPMPGDKLFGMTPPTIVMAAGGAAPGETWIIERVLYGLREAPRWWGVFRNDRFMKAKIQLGEKFLIFESLETEENIWRIMYEGDPELQGILLIYVDDLLILSVTEIIETVYKWLVAEWKCSELQWMDQEHLRFLGVELRPMGEGIHVSQAGYIRDLLRQHAVEEKKMALTVPCTRDWLQDEDTDDDLPQAEEAIIRLAQKATGEILWLSTRSRPELAHPVACMAARATRNPTKTLEIAKRVLNYLARTVEFGLHYVRDEESMLTVYSDASYAPGGGRSFGCIMAQVCGMPVCWRASKQPVITLSVAEAELYEAVSAVQLGLGVASLLYELGQRPVMHLKIDNSAAQGLASEAPGSWKTRHLRLRARFLRQETAAQRLTISHVPGELQKADLGTKSFDVPKFRTLLGLWKIGPYGEGLTDTAVKAMRKLSHKGIVMFLMVCMLMIQGARADVKEDLPIETSMELYVVVVLGAVFCVVLWEVLKKMTIGIKSWWVSWTKKQRKLERLRERAEAAVREELKKQVRTSPGYDAEETYAARVFDRSYTLCNYCDRDKPLFRVSPAYG
ncbi:RE1 [Symbiodinium microadriaticum]|nr:RE1 [Symbiodinium microadriaticum]